MNRGPSTTGGGCLGRGCLTPILVVVVILVLLTIFGGQSWITDGAAGLSGSPGIAASTVRREALPASASVETDYYTDEPGWISRPSTLEKGLRSFYKATGVQPYVYITDGSHGISYSQLKSFAEETYDRLFTDEAHYLMAFYDDGAGSYSWGYAVGSQAKTVMDSEASEILADYVDRYYDNTSLSDEEFFSLSFEKTGERIMTVTRTPAEVAGSVLLKLGIVVLVLIALIVAIIFWTRGQIAKQKKAEETAQILNTPLEEMVDPELKDLEEKYSDPDQEQE